MGADVRYVLHPGWVISKNDRDRHYVSARRLASLYGLGPDDRIIVVPNDGPLSMLLSRAREGTSEGDVHLYPDFTGRYRLPE